jgi:sRNA-binding protein
MSYEDLEEARARRAIKDAANAKGKGKRGRKAKSAVPETEEAIAGKENPGQRRKNPEPEAGPSESRKTKIARMSEALEPARALMARMI